MEDTSNTFTDLDPDLFDEAHHLGGQDSVTDTLNEALREYVARRQQRRVLELFGTIEYDPRYDYKEQRRR